MWTPSHEETGTKPRHLKIKNTNRYLVDDSNTCRFNDLVLIEV